METLSKDELIEMKRRKIAAMTEEEHRDMFNQACERAMKQHNDEFIRQHMERFRQSDGYNELLRRKKEALESPT